MWRRTDWRSGGRSSHRRGRDAAATTADDVPLIVAGRDAAFRRFIGEGSANPDPRFCIVVDASVVGWVDHDRDEDRWWLAPDEVNVGYHVFPTHRGRSYATRAVALLLAHLRDNTDCNVATLLIHPDNVPSLAIAQRHGFQRGDDVDGRTFWRRLVRPGTPPRTHVSPWSR